MPAKQPIITRETFQFFRDLARNNRTEWMEENRQRYKQCVVEPFRRLCEELAPTMLRLDSGFDTCGRTGANFSRINRDTRFANDKTPYRPQMYLKFSVPFGGEGETGQLYTGISADAVTAGFRIYSGSKHKQSALALVAEPRLVANAQWLSKQKTRLSNIYESYWYSTEKGKWTQRSGWPTPGDWEQLRGWIVRRKLRQTAAVSTGFPRELGTIFRQLFPLLRFTSLRD